MKGSQKTFLYGLQEVKYLQHLSSLVPYLQSVYFLVIFLTPAVELCFSSLGWDRTPMTKSTLYSIYFFVFDPEKSHFPKPILTLGAFGPQITL